MISRHGQMTAGQIASDDNLRVADLRPEPVRAFSECRSGFSWQHEHLATMLLLPRGKSAYPLPGEGPDLFLFRRTRPHATGQFFAGYLEVAYETLAHIAGR